MYTIERQRFVNGELVTTPVDQHVTDNPVIYPTLDRAHAALDNIFTAVDDGDLIDVIRSGGGRIAIRGRATGNVQTFTVTENNPSTVSPNEEPTA